MDLLRFLYLASSSLFVYLIFKLVELFLIWEFKHTHGCQAPRKAPQWETIIGLEIYNKLRQQLRDRNRLETTTKTSVTYSGVIMGQKFLSTRDPENIKAVLATNFQDFGLGKRKEAFDPFLGLGIFTSDGAHWEHSRALFRPIFTKIQVSKVAALEQHMQALLSRIPVGQTIDLQPLFFRQQLDTGTEMLFGTSIHSQTAETHSQSHKSSFAEAFDYAQEHTMLRSQLGIFRFLLRDKKFLSCCGIVHRFVDGFVEKALAARDEKPLKDPEPAARYVLLDELVKETQNPLEIRYEVLNILLAARDTTAGLLSNTFHALARHPEIWRKLREEVRHLDGQPPSYETLKNMAYLKCVLNEALRLYPSVPVNARYANKNTTVPRGGGALGISPVFIPKGSIVSYSVYAMHREKSIYGADAEDFRPERWLQPGLPGAPSVPLRPGWAYLPFNGGPRACIGRENGLVEAGYTIVRLVQEFSSIEARDDKPWAECLNLTLSSAEGTKVAFSI